jgi:hypothetical protein
MSAVLAAGLLTGLAVVLARSSGNPARLRRAAGRAREVARGSPGEVPAPLVLDLVAAVLGAGAPVPATLRLVAGGLEAYGAGVAPHLLALARRHELALPDPPPYPGPEWVQLLDRTLLLARDAGVPPAALLVSAAADERRRRTARRRLAAARLGVRVVLPTGLCLLPAFVLLTVVPMVLALLGGE